MNLALMKHQPLLMELIVDMHQQGQTILAVLHDSERVAAISRRRCAWTVSVPAGEQRSRKRKSWHDLASLSSRLLSSALCVVRWWSAWRCRSAPPCWASFCNCAG
jgi:hypothetical protein